LPELSKEDLLQLGFKFGPALKLLGAVKKFLSLAGSCGQQSGQLVSIPAQSTAGNPNQVDEDCSDSSPVNLPLDVDVQCESLVGSSFELIDMFYSSSFILSNDEILKLF